MLNGSSSYHLLTHGMSVSDICSRLGEALPHQNRKPADFETVDVSLCGRRLGVPYVAEDLPRAVDGETRLLHLVASKLVLNRPLFNSRIAGMYETYLTENQAEFIPRKVKGLMRTDLLDEYALEAEERITVIPILVTEDYILLGTGNTSLVERFETALFEADINVVPTANTWIHHTDGQLSAQYSLTDVPSEPGLSDFLFYLTFLASLGMEQADDSCQLAEHLSVAASGISLVAMDKEDIGVPGRMNVAGDAAAASPQVARALGQGQGMRVKSVKLCVLDSSARLGEMPQTYTFTLREDGYISGFDPGKSPAYGELLGESFDPAEILSLRRQYYHALADVLGELLSGYHVWLWQLNDNKPGVARDRLRAWYHAQTGR